MPQTEAGFHFPNFQSFAQCLQMHVDTAVRIGSAFPLQAKRDLAVYLRENPLGRTDLLELKDICISSARSIASGPAGCADGVYDLLLIMSVALKESLLYPVEKEPVASEVARLFQDLARSCCEPEDKDPEALLLRPHAVREDAICPSTEGTAVFINREVNRLLDQFVRPVADENHRVAVGAADRQFAEASLSVRQA